MSLEHQCICGACEDCLDAMRCHEAAVIRASSIPVPTSSREPLDALSREMKRFGVTPAIPSTPNPELEAALDDFQYAVASQVHPEASPSAPRAAWDALVSLYSRLQQEVAGWKGVALDRDKEAARLREVNANLADANRDRIAEFTAAQAELSRLWELTLTQEEAEYCIDLVKDDPFFDEHPAIEILAKLSRSASPGDSPK